MRATFLYGAGDVRVEEVPDPTIQHPTDAIVRVVRACVCGSDLHPYHSLPASDTGLPMGHEFLGVVEETGADVTGVTKGDFVIGTFAFQDNTCVFCREGFQTSCVNGGWYGTPEVGGVQAELTADALGRAPDGVPRGPHGQGDAERIILMGRHTARTDLGREFGATAVVAERGEEGIAAVLDLTGGEGSHIVLEAVGHMPAYQQVYGIVHPGGIVSRVGVPQYEEAPIGFGSLFGKNATLTGGPAPVRAYVDQALPDVLEGRIDPGRVFDLTVDLDHVAEGYRAMNDREALKALKALVRP